MPMVDADLTALLQPAILAELQANLDIQDTPGCKKVADAIGKAVAEVVITYLKANADVVSGGTLVDSLGAPCTGKGKLE